MQKKNIIYAMLCLFVAFAISGCGKTEAVTPIVTPTPTFPVTRVTTAPTQTIIPPIETPASNEPSIAPLETVELTIYTLNSDTLEKEAITVLVMVEDELTAELIAEQVAEAMEEEGFYLGINGIIPEEESVRIDFKSDAAPVIDVGASVEGSIIDVLAQSILDNLPQYKKIYISIEGGPYHSGHLEFELDDVYLGR